MARFGEWLSEFLGGPVKVDSTIAVDGSKVKSAGLGGSAGAENVSHRELVANPLAFFCQWDLRLASLAW